MSQEGILDIIAAHPEIPTLFIANVGSAVPALNELNIFSSVVAAGSIPTETTGSGNTITTTIQRSQAIPSTDASKIGLSAFDSNIFTVDSNGFVTVISGTFLEDIIVQSGTSPVVPLAGTITFNGGAVVAGSIPVQTHGASAHTMVLEVQISQAIAATDPTTVGLCAFNSANFSVDVNGFVSLDGSVALSFNTDSGTATPSGNAITISGSSTGLTTTGSGSTVGMTGTLVVGHGGTGAASFNTNGVVISNTSGTGALAALSLTDGQIVIGSSAGVPLAETLTPGTGISITNGHNSITIAATGSEMVWTDEAISFAAVSGNAYFITAGSVVATLPGSPSQGNQISFAVDTTSSFEILANTGQTIRIGSALSGSAGNAVNNARGDSVTLVYRSSDTEWIATSVIGTWTVT